MDLNRTAQDLAYAYRGISFLDDLNRGVVAPDQAADIADFLNAPAASQDYVFPGTQQIFRIWFNNDSVIVLALGALTYSAAQDVVSGYLAGPSGTNPQGFNSSAQIIANYVFNNAIVGVLTGRKRMFFFGHSFGGVVMLALAAIVSGQAGPPNISVITYGSPRSGNRNAQLALGSVDSWRWTAFGDRVQFLPPNPMEAPIINAVLGRSASLTCQQFGHLTNTSLIYSDGAFETVLTEPLVTLFTDVSLVNFAVNSESATAVEHAIINYERSLSIAYNNAARALLPMALPVPGPVMGPRVPPPMPNNAPLDPEILGAAVSAQPPNPNYDVSELPYYHEKDGGQWWVKSDDLPITVCKTAKQARALARALNSSWRKWNASLLGSATALDFSVTQNFLD